MPFAGVGGTSIRGGYAIDNSLRFNDNDSPRLDRTSVSSPTDSKIFTFSVWLKKTSIGSNFTILDARSGTNRSQILFRSGSNEAIRIVETSNNFASFDTLITTNALYRDVSAWYHVLIKYDSTNGTANNRFLIYVNGVEQSLDINTSVTLNYTTPLNEGNYTNDLGHADGAEPFDGYIAEAHFIDGQALSPTSFGEFDADSGIWKPKQYTGTYGTNGFYLDFEDSAALGDDVSGNGNDFTPTNLASTDQTTDTPTNNFATMNPLILRTASSPTFSEGNCKVVQSAANGLAFSSISVSSGKWYVEVKVDAVGGLTACGIIEPSIYDNGNPDTQSITYQNSGNKKNLTTSTSYGASYTTGDIIGIAFDADNGTLIFYKNGVSQGTAFTGLDTTTDWIIGCLGYNGTASNNYGNPSFSISSGNSDGNGYGNFEYTPPSGYLALCTQNLATELSPTIDDGSQYFNTVLYTGNHPTGQSITGVGFQPDWVWAKCRSAAQASRLFDSTRGALNNLISSATNAEQSLAGSLTSFDSDGFTLGSDDSINFNGRTFVAWNWLANGGTTSSNTDGSITSTVQANPTAGFSIVTYTGTGSAGTVGHGLGIAPKMVIVKRRDSTGGWWIHNTNLTSASYGIRLDTTGAEQVASAVFNNTFPTSTVFSLGTNIEVNTSSATMVAYCFAPIEGYSKFGKYTGNANADGTFVYTGFKPAFVIFKRTDAGADQLAL
jgi:hypothetical protein